jgi:hypothetical protein
MPSSHEIIQTLLSDIELAIETIIKHPKKNKSDNVAIYGMMAKSPIRKLVKSNVSKFMESMYSNNEQTADVTKDVKLPFGSKWLLKILGD